MAKAVDIDFYAFCTHKMALYVGNRFYPGSPSEDQGWKMIDKCRMAVLILVMLAAAIVAVPAIAQVYTGTGAGVSGGSGVQVAGGGVSAGPGGVRTFSLGSGFMYSITSVSPNDALQLQNQGVRVITVPAGKTIYITSQAGQPLDIKAGDQSAMPNMIVFGPGGFMGTGVWAGPGTGAWAGAGPGAGTGVFVSPGGVSINTVPGAGTSIQVGGGAGAGGVSIGTGPGIGTMQMYSFTGSAGETYLITQQSGGTTDRVLVVFQ
jgi:hypothetical protein